MITLEDIKRDLRVTHNSDDPLLSLLLAAAIDEALRFMNRTELPTLPVDYPSESSSEDVPSSEDPIAASVYAGVFLLVRAKYDAADGDEIARLRHCAESVLMPYRRGLGV